MKLNDRSFLILLFFAGPGWQPVHDSGINIEITRLRNSNGQVLVSLFKDENGYPDNPGKAIRKGTAIIAGNKATISFSGLPAGKYAAVVLHDENNNMIMDRTWVGKPKEGYGFSNNVTGLLGPPGFSKASFQHGDDRQTDIIIKLKY
ncbi:MAG TPA: DUF2141 domain-containing protein [Chitinophagaceae bacterium]